MANLNQILDELEVVLDFIVGQLQETRFTGKHRLNVDGKFEEALLKLIDIFSVVCLDALKLIQDLKQMDESRRLFSIIERLLQSCLIVRHPYEKTIKCGPKVNFYKHVLKTNANLKFQVEFFAPRLLKEVKGKLAVNGMVVNEKIAEKYQSDPKAYKMEDCCATLSHTKQNLEMDKERNVLVAIFGKFTVLNISRAERKNTDIVTDEKVVFVFHTYFKLQNRDIDVSKWPVS